MSWIKRDAPDETGHSVYHFVPNPKPPHEKKYTAISWMSGETIASFENGQEAKRFADEQGFISFIPNCERQHHPRACIEDRGRKIVYWRTDWGDEVKAERPDLLIYPLDEEYHASGTDLIGEAK